MPVSPSPDVRTTIDYPFHAPRVSGGRVGIIGSVTCDEIIRVPSPLKMYAQDRMKIAPPLFRLGGGATHAAVARSRKNLYLNSVVMAAVAQDGWGDVWMERMKKAGVVTRFCVRYQGRLQMNKVQEDDLGQRRIFMVEAQQAMRRPPYNLSPIPSLEGLLILGGVDAEIVRKAVESAARAGVPVSWRPSLEHAALLPELGPWINLIQIDRNDAATILGTPEDMDPANMVQALQRRTRARYAVVTAGTDVCFGAGSGGGGSSASPAPQLARRGSITGWRSEFLAFTEHGLKMAGGSLCEAMEFASQMITEPSLQLGT